MGLLRTAFLATLGPLLLWGFLVGHLVCRIYFQTPEPVSVLDFPVGTTKEVRDNVIDRRQVLIQDTTSMYTGTYKSDFTTIWCTPDVEFEDPLQKYEGRTELAATLQAYTKYLVSASVKLRETHHGQSEIVLDWELTMNFSYWGPMTVPMRTHLMLIRPTKIGGYENIFRIYEEWYGNKLLTKDTTIGFLGQMHQSLRRFTGMLVLKLLQNGYL